MLGSYAKWTVTGFERELRLPDAEVRDPLAVGVRVFGRGG